MLLHRNERDTRIAMIKAIEDKKEEGLMRLIREYQEAHAAATNFEATVADLITEETNDA